MILDRLLAPDLPAPLAWCVLLWLFAVGACIGSFMNVVIYRLPAGLSLLHPPSRCPACETPIRATDNVPIFGWLWLRGRCRQCRAAISARYPAVELLAALVFVALAWSEPLASGGNLPASASDLTMAELWGMYAYHLFLLCSLVCAAFIEFDGDALPRRLAVTTLVIGFAAPMFWPQLRPVAAMGGNVPLWFKSLVDGFVGATAGAALGCIVWLVGQIRPRKSDVQRPKSKVRSPSELQVSAQSIAVVLAWVGAFLGWQAAVGLTVMAIATRMLAIFAARWVPVVGRLGFVGCLTPWTVVWLVAWKSIIERLPWLGAG